MAAMPTRFDELLQQARELQERLSRVEEEAAKRTAEGSAGGGMVVAVATGKGEIVRVTIEPEVIRVEDRELLQDLVVAAVNQALEAGRRLMAERISEVAGGLNLPGLPR